MGVFLLSFLVFLSGPGVCLILSCIHRIVLFWSSFPGIPQLCSPPYTFAASLPFFSVACRSRVLLCCWSAFSPVGRNVPSMGPLPLPAFFRPLWVPMASPWPAVFSPLFFPSALLTFAGAPLRSCHTPCPRFRCGMYLCPLHGFVPSVSALRLLHRLCVVYAALAASRCVSYFPAFRPALHFGSRFLFYSLALPLPPCPAPSSPLSSPLHPSSLPSSALRGLHSVEFCPFFSPRPVRSGVNSCASVVCPHLLALPSPGGPLFQIYPCFSFCHSFFLCLLSPLSLWIAESAVLRVVGLSRGLVFSSLPASLSFLLCAAWSCLVSPPPHCPPRPANSLCLYHLPGQVCVCMWRCRFFAPAFTSSRFPA